MNLIALTEEEAAVVAAFQQSPEYRRARLPYRLIWVSALLDCLTAAELAWADLDLRALRALLSDGMRWTIARPPAHPQLVARELHAFLRWAARALGHPHAAACCAYLRSRGAIDDIRRGLVPLRRDAAVPAAASNSC
jgi:hypothetical protein